MVRACDSSTQEVEAESVPATYQGPSQPGLHEAPREEGGREKMKKTPTAGLIYTPSPVTFLPPSSQLLLPGPTCLLEW